MQKHPAKESTFICENPETVILSFSPEDNGRRITYGFKETESGAFLVANDQIHVQMGAAQRTLFVKFFFPAGSNIPCSINLQGSAGGNFNDPPPIFADDGDGQIRIYTFQ